MKLNFQALLCRLQAFPFHIVEFLVSLCQFFMHVVNKIVVPCFSVRASLQTNKEKNGDFYIDLKMSKVRGVKSKWKIATRPITPMINLISPLISSSFKAFSVLSSFNFSCEIRQQRVELWVIQMTLGIFFQTL